MSASVIIPFLLLSLLLCLSRHVTSVSAFIVKPPLSPSSRQQPVVATAAAAARVKTTTTVVLHAGGFEYEDPGEAFDQGVENPFKNPELMVGSEEGMKVDPARLLSPRLNGSNLYLIGMMGTGKSTIGNIVARRKILRTHANEFLCLLLYTTELLCCIAV